MPSKRAALPSVTQTPHVQITKASEDVLALSEEVEIMQYLSKGMPLKAIGKELKIPVSAVKSRILRAFKNFTLESVELREHIRIETYLQSKYLIEKGFAFLDDTETKLTPAVWKTIAEVWLEITKYQATLFALPVSEEGNGGQVNNGIVINNNQIVPTINATMNDPLYAGALEGIKNNYAKRYGTEVLEYEKQIMGEIAEVDGQLEIIAAPLDDLEDEEDD